MDEPLHRARDGAYALGARVDAERDPAVVVGAARAAKADVDGVRERHERVRLALAARVVEPELVEGEDRPAGL